ncbi:MAG: hypothetical protein ACRETM_04605 [Stenotrophobium sp.]
MPMMFSLGSGVVVQHERAHQGVLKHLAIIAIANPAGSPEPFLSGEIFRT